MGISETTLTIQEELKKAYQIWDNTKTERDRLAIRRKTLESELGVDDKTR